MRKGQRLCNYIQKDGVKNEDVHSVLFNMSDKEFEKGLNFKKKMKSKKCKDCGRKSFWKNEAVGQFGNRFIEYVCKKCGRTYVYGAT